MAGGAYGTLPPRGELEASSLTSPRNRSAGSRLVVALFVGLTFVTVAVVSRRVQPQPVDLASAPAASDFFNSALQGLESSRFERAGRGAAPNAARGRREVRLTQDKHGDVNLNVDIERNGKLVGRDTGLKVPVGKMTRLQLAMPRKGRLQQLDEDVPVMPAYSNEDEADADADNDGDDDDAGEPVDDDDISELGTAKRQVGDAKERVVEDAKRLHDITHAIQEESQKAETAQDYKVAAQEGEADAKRRAIDEVEEEKEALVQAKKRADTLAISRDAEAMKAKMQAVQAQSEAKTAEARAHAAEQAAQLELEKKKESLAADAEQQAWDKYQTAEVEKAEAVRHAKTIATQEKELAKTDGDKKKKEGAVNMNIKVNVDSPVGGDYSNWEERCAMEPGLAGCSPAELEAKKEEEKRQVNMNIVVNVRSPTDTADPGAAVAVAAGGAAGQGQELSSVAMPLPP